MEFYTATDVMIMLGVGRAKAYSLLKEWNEDLKKKGYVTVAGKIPKRYLEEKIYGYHKQ